MSRKVENSNAKGSSSTFKIGKLDEAIKLVKKPQNREEAETYYQNLDKGISLFNQLCLDANISPDDKFDVIVAYVKYVPEDGQDMIIRIRDMIPFLRGKQLEDLLDLLVKIVKCPDIDPHQRMTTAVNLYNNCFLNRCYGCFVDLACDKSIDTKYRVDAARYLFGSESANYKQIAQEALIEVIDTDVYPSEYRYSIITGFISRTGINSIMNMKKLRVPYDEEFVHGLQTNFFYNEANGVRERILSGQHMLQMDGLQEEEKIEIANILLAFAHNKDLSENTRADAADVILRLGIGEQKKEARQIIVDLGFSSVDTRKTEGTIIDKSKTIYNDSQNIHEFTEQIDKFIEKIINETSVTIRPYHEVHQEVSDRVREWVTDAEEKFRAFKALNRISIDTARFTSYKVTLAEIFVHVWIRIQNYNGEDRIELEKRMIEELVDMGDTCSSGHSGRFVNVLSTHDVSLSISFWSDQIKANMTGRMTARIRDCEDEDLREKLAMAQSDLADDEDRRAYNAFINSELPILKVELYKEFVGEGYVSPQEFEEAFETGKSGWLLTPIESGTSK